MSIPPRNYHNRGVNRYNNSIDFNNNKIVAVPGRVLRLLLLHLYLPL
jgi:hypothetical protein